MGIHALLLAIALTAQPADDKVVVSGSVQSDVLIPQTDESIGAATDNDWAKTNTYADVRLQHRYVDAGIRMEYLDHPLPGYENDFKGWGVPHFYVTGKLERAELTLGTFYEQFGSGFILRTYEERSLGIDNSLLGGRLTLRPSAGVTLKALSGCQRRYWNWNKALVSGADVELDVEEWVPALKQGATRLMIGLSWVNRHEENDAEVFADATHKVNFPRFVNAWDVRASLNSGPWSVLAEYAQKTDDPSFANGYIFRCGNVAMLSGSYSQKGLSVLLQARRSENMSFKSTGDPVKAIGIASAVNHLPAFTQDHTYALAALYPYATQLADGEWAFQAEAGYSFKRHTTLGGRYGTSVKVNFSHVRALQRDFVTTTSGGSPAGSLAGLTALAGTDGYTSPFFKWGATTYYQDLNVQLSRRLSRSFKLQLMYMNQRYNKTVVEGHGGMVCSNIFVADGLCRLTDKTSLRGELQWLTTPDDQGDWAFGLLELSLVPHWMVTVSDMYNAGESHLHYYQGLLTYTAGAHRLMAGYGRTRAGYNCAGGVCRYVPASKGFTLSYNYVF